jgi:uncharacterized membrane protein YecN with MAPEG domain
MPQVQLTVTLATASALTLVYAGIVVFVVRGRFKHKLSMGDGGDIDMVMRMRTQANFIEYVPLLLILMGLMELAGVNRTVLGTAGAVLVVLRIMHAVGMPRPAPNFFRATGATLTLALMIAAGVYGLVVALG